MSVMSSFLRKFKKKLVPAWNHVSVLDLDCESSQMGKHYHVSYPLRANKRVNKYFELVHFNVWVQVKSIQNLILNIFSHLLMITLL